MQDDAAPLPDAAREVLDFWFRELGPKDWFGAGEALDPIVTQRFATLHRQAEAGNLEHWARSVQGRLALVILFDQFSRHIYRASASAFRNDIKAQALTMEAIASGEDEMLDMTGRHFLYMPLMHSEDKAMQERSIAAFSKLVEEARGVLEFAREHADTIERFGRFPYRNEALGRDTSEPEQAYLDARASDR